MAFPTESHRGCIGWVEEIHRRRTRGGPGAAHLPRHQRGLRHGDVAALAMRGQCRSARAFHFFKQDLDPSLTHLEPNKTWFENVQKLDLIGSYWILLGLWSKDFPDSSVLSFFDRCLADGGCNLPTGLWLSCVLVCWVPKWDGRGKN